MKKRLYCFLMLIFIISVSGTSEAKDKSSSQQDRCPVCGMFVSMFADWNGEITFRDSTRVTFDGPKDLFKYYLNVKKYNPSKTRADVVMISVKDYSTKTPIDAQKAFYVIWGDVYGPMGNEPVPFEKEDDAQKFLKEHRGRKILLFTDITTELLYSLDNP